ncbi:MAG: glycosyltransferase [Actinomycetota bacterium]
MSGPSELRILVSLRSDAATKPGGDVNLLRGFGDELADRHRVETVIGVPNRDDLRSADVVLTANLDRPVEPAATLARAEQAGVPMVHYTLHHPAAGVRAYLENGAHGVRRVLARAAGGSPTRYEQLLWTLHAGATLVRDRRRPAVGSVRAAQERLLSSARLVVSSLAEAEAITADLGSIGAHDVVAHPADFPPGEHRPTPGRVVVPGRIESRKNQLLTLALARRFPDTEFLLVGGYNPADARYQRLVAAELARTANATHVEHLPKDEFYPLVRTAQVIVSASWFEVTSLIERYGAANGIPMVISRHSYLADADAIRPDTIHRFDPSDLDQAAGALSAALADEGARSDRSGPGSGGASNPVGLTTRVERTITEVVEAAVVGARP